MHAWLILFICLFSVSGFCQNYIKDYLQPSILGHEEILKGDFYKAIEYLEVCNTNEKVLPPDSYSLGICYFFTERIEEGKNKIYQSYRDGHTKRALKQDSIILYKYFSEDEYISFADSCSQLLALHDSLKKIKYAEEESAIHDTYILFWGDVPYFDSIKKAMDSLTYAQEIPNIKATRQKKLQNKVEALFESFGWEKVNLLVDTYSFIYFIMRFPEEDLEILNQAIFKEVKKGTISPVYYAYLYDMLQKRYGDETKYRSTSNPNLIISVSENEILKNDRFQIGIGSSEVMYLMHRDHSF